MACAETSSGTFQDLDGFDGRCFSQYTRFINSAAKKFWKLQLREREERRRPRFRSFARRFYGKRLCSTVTQNLHWDTFFKTRFCRTSRSLTSARHSPFFRYAFDLIRVKASIYHKMKRRKPQYRYRARYFFFRRRDALVITDSQFLARDKFCET